MIRFIVAGVAAFATFGCTLAGGFEYGAAPGAVSAEQAVTVFIDRTRKGDRLNFTAMPAPSSDRSSSSTAAPVLRSKPPLGCDPLFSLIADPQQSHKYGRCAT